MGLDSRLRPSTAPTSHLDQVKHLPEPSENIFQLLADPSVSLTALCEFVGSNASPIINEAQILESRVYIERRADRIRFV